MRFFSSFLRIIGLCAAALLLASCSAVRLGYNQLPDLTYWWLDSYIDTADAQTPRLRREIDALHQWHRASELPEYAHLLQKMQRLAPGPISPEQACALFSEVRGRFDVLSARVENHTLWLAQSLTPAQLEHMERKYAKSNSEWQDKWLRGSPAERQQRSLKLAVERYETLYGTLDAAQTQLLRAGLAASSMPPQALWAERLRRQQDIVQTLRRLGSGTLAPEPARQALHALLGRLSTSPDTAYRTLSEISVREHCALFSRLHQSTTAAQRARGPETLKNYESDVRALAIAGR